MPFDLTVEQAQELMDLCGAKIVVNRHIAAGGQKVAFEATWEGKQVALKIINPTADPQRIQREIQAMVRLESPYVARFYGYWQEVVANVGVTYLCEEFLAGETLRERIGKDVLLARHDAIVFLDRLAEGLEMLEKEHLVHRDIKPENIMIRSGTFRPQA